MCRTTGKEGVCRGIEVDEGLKQYAGVALGEEIMRRVLKKQEGGKRFLARKRD